MRPRGENIYALVHEFCCFWGKGVQRQDHSCCVFSFSYLSLSPPPPAAVAAADAAIPSPHLYSCRTQEHDHRSTGVGLGSTVTGALPWQCPGSTMRNEGRREADRGVLVCAAAGALLHLFLFRFVSTNPSHLLRPIQDMNKMGRMASDSRGRECDRWSTATGLTRKKTAARAH